MELAADPLLLLVVEDSEGAVRMVARLLGTAGHDVQTARNGTEALVVAQSFHPQVVLIDIGLPGLDILHVVRQLRKSRAGVVLTASTGRSELEDLHSSEEAGFNHYLVQPLVFRKLFDLLANAGGGTTGKRRDAKHSEF